MVIKMNINDKLVVGHIGRFSLQKNHEFLIDIFHQISKYKKDAILLLVGVGELQDNIKKKVNELGLSDKVQFLGIRSDINELLNAFDIFILPSFFEGLPVVGVEAQATGLTVYTSDLITKDLPINNLVKYYSLNDSAETWAKNILENHKKVNRENTTELIKQSGFEVKSAAEKMEKIYLNLYKEL